MDTYQLATARLRRRPFRHIRSGTSKSQHFRAQNSLARARARRATVEVNTLRDSSKMRATLMLGTPKFLSEENVAALTAVEREHQ